MSLRDEAEQGFPPQRHQEPLALRQDILDELTDHLSLAADRESESGAMNEQEIRTRVLNKFGDPTAIARSLWWDAMKETIVKDWIQISINALLCIVVVGFMTIFYRQMQSNNIAFLGALNERSTTAEELYPSVEFIFHRGTIDGPVAEGIQLLLSGKPFNEDATDISEESDDQGYAKFGPIRAGLYTVYFTDEKTGMRSQKSLTLYTGDETKTIHVPVPPNVQIPIDTTAPFPERVTDRSFRLFATVQAQWSHEGDLWKGVQPKSVILTHDGVFQARSWPDNEIIYPRVIRRPRNPAIPRQPEYKRIMNAGERIIQTYGNRQMFSGMIIAQSYFPEKDGEECFRLLKDDGYSYRSNAEVSHDLQSGQSNSIRIDVPPDLLTAYGYYTRRKANADHGLPKRFSWFPETVSHKFPDFVIEEAHLVELSGMKLWKDDFIRKLNDRGGKQTFQVPTEAEWEYACRAESTTAYSFGDFDAYELQRHAWYKESSGGTAHPVGQLAPNAWGLYDMHGNVEEWCEDWKANYDRGAQTDPAGPGRGSNHVKRGGGWFHNPRDCRSANRADSSTAYTNYYLGLRLVATTAP